MNKMSADPMKHKTALITGANRGIGKAIALELAGMGARVLMVCRDTAAGQAARKDIMASSQNSDVDLLIADLSWLAEVRSLAKAIQERYKRLDVLINNAGVAKKARTMTRDGLEMTFAVNHLAPFLLTNLLLDLLESSAPARIINVSSMVHKWGHIDFEDLQGEKRYDMDGAYNQSKLANLLFTYELARKLDGTGVTANSLEPGMVATDFGREYTGFKAFMNRLWRVFMKTTKQGADTAVFLASSSEVAGVSGGHFADRRLARASQESRDPALAVRLWQISATLTGL